MKPLFYISRIKKTGQVYMEMCNHNYYIMAHFTHFIEEPISSDYTRFSKQHNIWITLDIQEHEIFSREVESEQITNTLKQGMDKYFLELKYRERL